ncbi:hypothetical protein [Nocardia sp. NBC_01009]|uniref:hypothetical protein n=1 Tax=Nocardia sp. NBC_01009 TaxID=2975996 RepID=UPI0038647B5B|nr:hypothetical protein OHA42_14305 [Nocardia sp. NBC_01009]
MVKLLERPVVLAVLYVVGSVYLGPALFLGGYALFAGGVMDYCDWVNGDPASRDAKFTAVQNSPVICAVTMLAVGLVLLANLWGRRHQVSRLRLTLSSLGILAMMCGYGCLIQMGSLPGPSCWPE